MSLATIAAPTGVWPSGHFRQVPGADQSAEGVTTSLTMRLGKFGEKPGDLLVVAVAHRSALVVDAALQLICTEEIQDATGIRQSLSMFYLQLGASDVGRVFKFDQFLALQLSVTYTVQRPVNTLAPLTVEASSHGHTLNASAPWPATPVTPTKVGQLIMVAQARVSVGTKDIVQAPFLPRSLSKLHSRITMFGKDALRKGEEVAGAFEMPEGIYPSTSVLTASVVFSLTLAKAKQNVLLRSAGATATVPSCDITEGGRLWTVRATAEPTYWHKALSTVDYEEKGVKYFEVEIVDGPAIGDPRRMCIGVASYDTITSSGSGGLYDMHSDRVWWNDGSVYDRVRGAIVPNVTPPWGKGDVLGLQVDMMGNGNYGDNVAGRAYGYLNGVSLGAILPSLYNFTDRTSLMVGNKGRGASIRFPSTLEQLPHGNTAW